MSPTHREPSKQEIPERAPWDMTWIFVTLIVLTIAMGLVVRGLVTGSVIAPTHTEQRAGRAP